MPRKKAATTAAMTNAQRMRAEVEHCTDLKMLRNTCVEMAQQYENAIQTAKDAIAGWTAANEQIREWTKRE